MVIEDIANLFEELNKRYSAKEIARHFDKERKFVYMMKAGCSTILNPEFLAGLKHYGYELRLVKLGGGGDRRCRKRLILESIFQSAEKTLLPEHNLLYRQV